MKCLNCSSGVAFGTKHCVSCLEKAKARSAERYKKIKMNRICKSCSNKVMSTKGIYCKKCSRKKKNTYHSRRKQELCVTCGKNKSTNGTKCLPCYSSYKNHIKNNREERLAKGLCAFCDNAKINNRLCLDHFLKFTAKTHLGSFKRYQELHNLFLKQEGICPYTKKKLVLGFDASVDHIVPKSRGGSTKIDNLQWVYYQVNFMKQDMLDDEFIGLVMDIASNFKTGT